MFERSCILAIFRDSSGPDKDRKTTFIPPFTPHTLLDLHCVWKMTKRRLSGRGRSQQPAWGCCLEPSVPLMAPKCGVNKRMSNNKMRWEWQRIESQISALPWITVGPRGTPRGTPPQSGAFKDKDGERTPTAAGKASGVDMVSFTLQWRSCSVDMTSRQSQGDDETRSITSNVKTSQKNWKKKKTQDSHFSFYFNSIKIAFHIYRISVDAKPPAHGFSVVQLVLKNPSTLQRGPKAATVHVTSSLYIICSIQKPVQNPAQREEQFLSDRTLISDTLICSLH